MVGIFIRQFGVIVHIWHTLALYFFIQRFDEEDIFETEDEAMAMALHMSLNDGAASSSSSSMPELSQEEADRRLAEQLQQGEYNQ